LGVAVEEDDVEVPRRIKSQIFFRNRLVGAIRFIFRILKKALPGKAEAYEEEDNAMCVYREKRKATRR